MKTKLIGLVGRFGSGKDSFWHAVEANCPNQVQATPHNPFKVVRVAWADEVKIDVCRMLGITWSQLEANKPKLRALLQNYGTLMREYRGGNYWIDRAKQRIEFYLKEGYTVIVTDCRFINEAEYITNRGGVLIRVTRKQELNEHSGHQSETESDLIKAQYEIENNGTLEEFKQKAVELYGKLQTVNNDQVSPREDLSRDKQSSEGHHSEGQPETSASKKWRRNKNKQARTSEQLSQSSTDGAGSDS